MDRDVGGKFIKGHKSFAKRDNHCNSYENGSLIIDSKIYGKVKIKYDLEDENKLKKVTWSLDVRKNKIYISSMFNRKKVYLHRYLLNTSKDIIDHINGDEMDNRKSNLRIANKSINAINREITAHKRRNKWGARVIINGKYYHLGHYDTKEEAIDVKKEFLMSKCIISKEMIL